MLLTAAQSHNLDLASSWMIGDSDIDVKAGRNAGCKTVRIVQGQFVEKNGADLSAGSLLDAVRQILALRP
jgi:D-glycero-D-manno-heptose 1,7-bisphosphate phosphatase